MKRLLFAALFAAFSALHADEPTSPASDPFAGAFFPPELALMARDRISLTEEQARTIRSKMEKAQPRSEELRAQLASETAILAALVKKEHAEEAAVHEQLDKVLNLEREVKHLHIGLGVEIKNLLTSEQQAKLRDLAKDKNGVAQLGEEVRKRLASKMARIQEGARKLQAAGQDPAPLIDDAMKKKFKPLMDGGKPIEAEAELDRILESLKQNDLTK